MQLAVCSVTLACRTKDRVACENRVMSSRSDGPDLLVGEMRYPLEAEMVSVCAVFSCDECWKRVQLSTHEKFMVISYSLFVFAIPMDLVYMRWMRLSRRVV